MKTCQIGVGDGCVVLFGIRQRWQVVRLSWCRWCGVVVVTDPNALLVDGCGVRMQQQKAHAVGGNWLIIHLSCYWLILCDFIWWSSAGNGRNRLALVPLRMAVVCSDWSEQKVHAAAGWSAPIAPQGCCPTVQQVICIVEDKPLKAAVAPEWEREALHLRQVVPM